MQPEPVAAQVVFNSGENEQLINIFPAAPRSKRQLLSTAEKAIADARYSDAVDSLDQILRGQEDETEDERAQDYFLGGPTQEGPRASLKITAQRLLGALPPKGRDAYELLVGTEARQLLDSAVRAGDPQKLTDVTRMYFHTTPGYEATMLLGRYHLDRGRPLAAAMCFKRIVDTPAAAEKFDPEASVLLATSWLFANLPAQAEEALVSVKNRMPGSSIRVGDKTVKLFDSTPEALAWLELIVGAKQTIGAADATQWLMLRGEPARNARSAGSMPLSNPRWFVTTVNDPADEQRVKQLSRRYLAQGLPALPVLHPLVVDNFIVMRTPEQVIGIDFKSGKRVWVFPWDDMALGGATSPDSATPGTVGSPRENELNQRVWEDEPYGQISSDGKAVFVLDDLGYDIPNASPTQVVFAGGVRAANPKMPKPHNKLVALELATEGKLLWEIGGSSGGDEPKLAEAFFLGPPLPMQGQLFVLAETNGEIRLVVLDSRTGRQQWSQQLAQMEANTILRDRTRRMAGATPSFADGILVCPTSAGAVVAVDLSTRSLLWGFLYDRLNGANYGAPGFRTPYRETRTAGQRWADATVTIVAGRVILTPVESNESFCLDLLTGAPTWPKNSARDELLYTACVHDGKVVFVGNNKVIAVSLANGKPEWATALPQDGMPSGRGFYTDHYYFVPTTKSQLVKIDIADGKIASVAETDGVLGNLVVYKDEVISHSVERLATFRQEGPLREQVARRLQANPGDVWALARRGELLLQDGHQTEALNTLRRAYQIDPLDDSLRSLLVNSLLAALREDFAANQAAAAELDDLIDQPAQYAEYLRLKATGLQEIGQPDEAFAVYLELANSGNLETVGGDPGQLETESVEPHLSIRRDRWIQARMASLFSSVQGDQRERMDTAVAARLDAALAATGIQPLRQFLDFFGTHPLGDRARIVLAERLIDADELLRAELLLSQLRTSSDPAIAASAAADTALLLEKSGRFTAAAAEYRRLLQRWPDVVCLNGIAGRQIVESAAARSGLGRLIDKPLHWATGATSVTSGGDVVITRPSYQRIYTVDVRQLDGASDPGLNVWLDQSNNSVVVRNGLGQEVTRVPLTDNAQRIYTNNYQVARCQVNGHLLMMTVGFEIVAVDMLRAAVDANDAILWRQDLTQSLPGAANSASANLRIQSKSVSTPWGLPKYIGTDTTGRLVGSSGPVLDRGLCFQRDREIVCVEPLTGQVLWTRDDVEPGAELLGDDEYLFAVAPKGNKVLVLNAIDGALVAQRSLAGRENRWASNGRRILTWRQQGTELVLSLYDLWTEADVWQRRFASGSKGWIVGQDEVAVLQPSGQFTVMSLVDSKPVVETAVEPERSLISIHVIRNGEQYILVTNTTKLQASPEVNIQAAPAGLSSPLVHGHVYSISRNTGRPTWQIPAFVDQFGLPLDQPAETPVLTFIRHITPSSRRGPQTLQTSVLCIDKRDGRIILSQEDIPAHTHSYEMAGKLEDQTVSLKLPGKAFTIQFTDAPTPPAPPAQTGAAASLLSTSELDETAQVEVPESDTDGRPLSAEEAARQQLRNVFSSRNQPAENPPPDGR